MQIIRAKIYPGQYSDLVNLYTDFPHPIPYLATGEIAKDHVLTLQFSTSRNYGKEYVEKNFPGVPIEIK
jgi:hypothetical protein